MAKPLLIWTMHASWQKSAPVDQAAMDGAHFQLCKTESTHTTFRIDASWQYTLMCFE